MASAVGIAVLDTIKEDGLQENSATLGKIFEIMDHNGHPVSCWPLRHVNPIEETHKGFYK